MEHMKTFTQLNESNSMIGNFYTLGNRPVYIEDIENFGNEYRVIYKTIDGNESAYIGSSKDIEEDFISSNSFEFDEGKKKKQVKTSTHVTKTYDLVYYMGNRKQETIQSNINIILANGLKRQYASFPNYRLGELRIIPNK